MSKIYQHVISFGKPNAANYSVVFMDDKSVLLEWSNSRQQRVYTNRKDFDTYYKEVPVNDYKILRQYSANMQYVWRSLGDTNEYAAVKALEDERKDWPGMTLRLYKAI